MFYFYSSPYNLQGIHVVQVDPISCTLVTQVQRFDPSVATDAAVFDSYMSGVTNGAVIAAVSRKEPTESAVDATLASLGVLASDVPSKGSFAFVTQKGYGYKTVLSKTTKSAATVTSFVSVALFGEYSLMMFV
jgi:hypothetical protein